MICHACGKKGHIAKLCRCKGRSLSFTRENCSKAGSGVSADSKAQQTYRVVEDSIKESDMVIEEGYQLYRITYKVNPPISVSVRVNGVSLQIKVDTVASLSLISEATFKELWGMEEPPLKPSDKILRHI